MSDSIQYPLNATIPRLHNFTIRVIDTIKTRAEEKHKTIQNYLELLTMEVETQIVRRDINITDLDPDVFMGMTEKHSLLTTISQFLGIETTADMRQTIKIIKKLATNQATLENGLNTAIMIQNTTLRAILKNRDEIIELAENVETLFEIVTKEQTATASIVMQLVKLEGISNLLREII